MPRTLKTPVLLATIAAVLLFSPPLAAKSVKEFNAMAPDEQSEYLVSFLEKMTYDIGKKNPKLAKDIKDYFVRPQNGRQFSEGMVKLHAELIALETLAKEGKADLSKIKIESIVVWVVKQKFPPPWKDVTKDGGDAPKSQPKN